jgi:hypothetical protein
MALFLCANILMDMNCLALILEASNVLLCHEFTALLTARNIPIVGMVV